VSKEAQRRAAARRQQRNAKAAKWTITGLMVMVLPALIYVAMQG
jgi:uncharacterized membrane protein